MDKDRLNSLLTQYFNDTISKTDCVELFEFLKSSDVNDVADAIDEEMQLLNENPEFSDYQKNKLFDKIQLKAHLIDENSIKCGPQIVSARFIKKLSLAASLILLFGAGILVYLMKKNNNDQVAIIKKRGTAQVATYSNRPTLILSSGKVVVLDTVSKYIISNTGNTKISLNRKSLVAFTTIPSAPASGFKHDSLPVYNLLRTPKGKEFQIVLCDGTKVWLNSASSLKFPSQFTSNERQVFLTGEGYFEVAKNKKKPFFVEINKTEIKVLGTHFNVAGYDDDPATTTTLIEGAVTVKGNHQSGNILPGEQAIINHNGHTINITKANIEKTLAWKNGYFIFDDTAIPNVMKEVSRWYDIQVEYRDDVSKIKFGGTFYKAKSINDLLSNIEEVCNIHFKIEGRRITVMK